MTRIALIVGASGIIGSNLARELLAQGWITYGLARNPKTDLPDLRPVAADLLNPANLETALADVAPTHVFLTSWMRQDTEAENIRVNGAMVRHVLAALSPKQSVQHVALVTGLKHYLGPFDS
jgi:nucleoside-diphosphate-sugar epimerase